MAVSRDDHTMLKWKSEIGLADIRLVWSLDISQYAIPRIAFVI